MIRQNAGYLDRGALAATLGMCSGNARQQWCHRVLKPYNSRCKFTDTHSTQMRAKSHLMGGASICVVFAL